MIYPTCGRVSRKSGKKIQPTPFLGQAPGELEAGERNGRQTQPAIWNSDFSFLSISVICQYINQLNTKTKEFNIGIGRSTPKKAFNTGIRRSNPKKGVQRRNRAFKTGKRGHTKGREWQIIRESSGAQNKTIRHIFRRQCAKRWLRVLYTQSAVPPSPVVILQLKAGTKNVLIHIAP